MSVTVPKHPKKDQNLVVRMTREEKTMLRTLAIRSPQGSDAGYLRFLIRREYARRHGKPEET